MNVPLSRPLLRALVLASVGLGTLVSATTASAAEQPSFQCRASALAVSLTDQPYIEPLVANGIKGSVPCPTFDKAQTSPTARACKACSARPR